MNMPLRWCALALLAFALPCHSRESGNPEGSAAAPEGFAGATAERADDPVFDGNVVLYHAGTPGAEAVVLVHGLGQNGARDWSGLIPELVKANCEVFALDLPGFGQSEKGNEAYGPEGYIKVIDKVLAPRVGRPFTLIGHSMGAAVSLGYAAAHPQRVKRLVLVDMAGVLQGAVYADFLSRGALASKGVPSGAPWFESLMRGAFEKMEGAPLDRDMVLRTPAMRQKLLRGDPNSIAAFGLANHDFSEALREVEAPTLLIWGQDDPVAPLRTGQMAAALIKDARLAVLQDVGHVPMKQDAAHFNALVLDELAGKTALAPFAARFAGAPAGGAQSCDGKDGQHYSGDIAKLTLIQCHRVDVSHARIGELRMLESDARVVDTQVTGGIYALRSQLELTAGSVAGGVKLDGSGVDAAGTRFMAERAVAENIGKTPVTLRLSVSELKRDGKAPRYVHDFVKVAPGESW